MEQLLLDHKKIQLTKEEREERNREILRLWRDDHLTYQVIGSLVGLSKVQVGEILKEAVVLHKRSKDFEKEKRIVLLERELEAKKDEPSKKDKVEILEQLRKEFEGEEKSNVVVNNIEVVIEYGRSNIQDQTQRQGGERTYLDAEASTSFSQHSQ